MRQRAKPLLGTLVEIRADCRDDAAFVAATDAAFARIASVHRAMTFHESTSDLQGIARGCEGDRVVVDQDTWNVLQLALHIERDSDGAFNPTIAPTLVRNGLLPRPANAGVVPDHTTLACSVRLDAPRAVQVLRPVWIDLGGIAKGYAVDVAVEALLEYGATGGVVNAGGDLRVFGDTEQQIGVRHPSDPAVYIPVASLREMSCASSGNYFVAAATGSATQTAIVGTRARRGKGELQASVTVFASKCAVADALTKVVWLAGVDSPLSCAMLSRYAAQAVALDSNGASIRSRPP